jgi:hypothetical protein
MKPTHRGQVGPVVVGHAANPAASQLEHVSTAGGVGCAGSVYWTTPQQGAALHNQQSWEACLCSSVTASCKQKRKRGQKARVTMIFLQKAHARDIR